MFFVSQRDAFLAAAALLVLTAGCGEPVKVPTSYAKWEPEGGTIFHIDYPEGWNADGGGKTPIQWAEFKKSGCLIKCKTNISTSAVGDIAGSTSNLLGGDEELSQQEKEDLAPAAAAHKWPPNLDMVKEDYSGYKEDQRPIAFSSGMGDARKSIFTATAMGRRLKGYRATFLARDYGIIIVCHCGEKDFEKMQPAFDKVLESVRHGGS